MTGLTEQAREVLETATTVANGETPENLLVVAAWARDTEDGLKLEHAPDHVALAARIRDKALRAKYATRS